MRRRERQMHERPVGEKTKENQEMSNSDLIEIEMQMHSHTQKAILVSDDGDEDSAVWLPVSQTLSGCVAAARLYPALASPCMTAWRFDPARR